MIRLLTLPAIVLALASCASPTALPATALPATALPAPTVAPTALPAPTVTPTALPATALPATALPAPTAMPAATSVPASIALTSSAFAEGGAIPVEFSCDGANTSPPLAWGDVPTGTKSLALIVEDPDADNYTHWVLFNIAPDVRQIAAGVPDGEEVTGIGLQAQNGFAKPGYGGPCPPSGTHQYTFTLYALNIELPLRPDPLSPVSKGMVRDALKGHVLGSGQLTGVYTRQ